ncbi:MAG TPA: malic enzyme-like NAD(P)-binding protein, partial [Terriglobia bacterium]|nr:malic enzyme-like NAD(P)-binding protein [Terriglobia bacterium]
EWIRRMAPNAIVFVCANPNPEIWPWDATECGATVVATGRGDFPNQLNNSIVFPAMFRGVLDVRASTISNGMAITAAREIAAFAEERGINPENILPRMDEPDLVPRISAVVGAKAQEEGLARIRKTPEELYAAAAHSVKESRRALEVLMREQIIRT